MAKGKPVIAWAAKPYWASSVCEWLTRGTPGAARRATVEWMADVGRLTWKQLYRRGWRIVRVRIEEVPHDR